MSKSRLRRRLVYLCVGASTALFIGIALRAAPNSEPCAETEVSQSQLLAILTVPAIQQELGLTAEQIAKLTKINVNPMAVPFAEAIGPIKTLLTPEQFRKFKRTAFQGLMVRAFTVLEVEDSLELTSVQKTTIATIQANLKTQLQPFQDKVNGREVADLLALDRDVATFHEEAYRNALKLLTAKQRRTWEELSKPVPLRKQ